MRGLRLGQGDAQCGLDLRRQAAEVGPAHDVLGDVPQLGVGALGHGLENLPPLVGTETAEGEDDTDRLVDDGVRDEGLPELGVFLLQFFDLLNQLFVLRHAVLSPSSPVPGDFRGRHPSSLDGWDRP